MSFQLAADYDEFVELAFVNDHRKPRDLSIAVDFARQFTSIGDCAFGAAGECGRCGRPVLNVEPFVDAVNARYRLNQDQQDDLRTRLMEDRKLNATDDGICESCHLLQSTADLLVSGHRPQGLRPKE